MSKDKENISDKFLGMTLPRDFRESMRKVLGSIGPILKKMESRVFERDWQNADGSPKMFDMDAAVTFARHAQEFFPQIVSTMISEIRNEETGATHLVQTMLDSDGKTVFADQAGEDFVGRNLPENVTLSPQLRELMGDDVKCVIVLPESLLTFEDAIAFAKYCQKTYPDIDATMVSRVENEKTGTVTVFQTMVDASGATLYTDESKENNIGRMLPPNTKLCDKLEALLENDVKCVIQLS